MTQTAYYSGKKIKNSIILLLVILVFKPQQTLPQTPLNYKSINTKNGLRDDIATAIAQDQMGYMWFGTRSGLVRYDGFNFVNYNHDPDFPDGLSGNQINALHVDKKSTLWIGTINGLCYFDRNLNRPVKIKMIIKGKEINPPIYRIDSDNDGIIWMGTANDGLISFNPDTKIFTQYKYDKDNKNTILSNEVNTVLCASDKTIWVGTNKGLNHYYPETKKFESYVSETGINPALSDNNVLSLAEGNNNGLWIGTANGLNHLDLNTNKITIYKNQPGNINSLSNNFVSALLFDKNFLWIGAGFGNNILNKMDVESGKITQYKFSADEINDNILGRMLDIKEDKTGIIWVAQSYGGVRYFDPRWQNYTQYVIEPDKKGDLINSTYGALPVSSTIFWVSTLKGLIKYDINKGLIKDYSSLSPVQVPYLDNAAVEINNKLWVPTKNIGILIFDLKSGNLKSLKYQRNNSNSISTNFVNILIKDSDGIVWAGSRNGGLDRIDPVTGKITRYHHDPNNPNSLLGNHIFALLDKDQDHLWVGSNSGLALFNKKTGLSKIYSYNPDDSTTISSNQISYLTRDKKGRLWISTYGGGLDLFIPSENKFQRFTSQKGNIPDNTIYNTIEDNSGNLWVSTSVGVARFLPDKKSFDFLLPFRDNYKSTKLPNGELLFSGPHGLLIFDPDKMSYNVSPPEVSISKLIIKGKEVLPGKGSVLKVNISQTKKIELNYSQNDIGFEFFASHYSNPVLNKYSVYLDGYDNQWRDLGSLNYINYTNLDPGKYILKLKAASAYNVWTDKPDELEIIINPPLWETWWAYTLYCVIFLVLLWRVDKFQKARAIRKEKERAQKRELEQAKEIEKAYKELKSTQAQLIHSEKMASLGELTAGIAHEIKNPLNFVNNFSEVSNELITDMLEEVDKGNTEEVKEIAKDLKQNLEKINHHGKRADSIVKGMLLHSRGTAGEKTPTDINDLLEQYVNLAYHGMRAQNKDFNITIERDYDKSLDKINVVPQDISRVFLNIINNACYAAYDKKKTMGDDFSPTIKVSTKNLNDKVEIRIKDNGNGVPDEIKAKLFQPFFTTKPTGEGTGLGLSLSYDIVVKQHGGEIKVDSKKEEGAEFIIIIPKL